MAWGARQEDGAWRICERRGRTIDNVTRNLSPAVEIRFPGRAMAEDCAAALNEYWPDYDRAKRSHPRAVEMIDIIATHKGISAADLKRVKDYINGSN